jgi:hypothetical protein
MQEDITIVLTRITKMPLMSTNITKYTNMIIMTITMTMNIRVIIATMSMAQIAVIIIKRRLKIITTMTIMIITVTKNAKENTPTIKSSTIKNSTSLVVSDLRVLLGSAVVLLQKPLFSLQVQ